VAGRQPADETLRAAVLRRLAVLDDLARHGDADDLLPLARTELHRLTDGWRLLLTAHQPGTDGRCRVCPARFRRRRWPCRVWTMAYQHLLGDGVPSVSRRPFRRHTGSRGGSRRRNRSATATG
jgi:hypothetical protein